MNKKVMIGIGLVLVVVLFFVLDNIVFNKSEKPSGYKELELTYKTNAGVPYKWEFEIEDESIVELARTKDITSDEDKELDGGPVSINYVFRGLKKGKTTITFKYVNVTDGTIKNEDKVTVKVDKYKNIALNAIP